MGDSASLSFLQLLRMMVESVSGPSNFTNDPMRHKIAESQLSVPHDARRTHLLPDKATAYILADAFFINVSYPSLIEPRYRWSLLLILIRHTDSYKYLSGKPSCWPWRPAILTHYQRIHPGYAC